MNGPPPENANAPTGRPRRSSDVNGSRHLTTTDRRSQYRMYAPGGEPLRDVLIRVLYGLGPDGAEVER